MGNKGSKPSDPDDVVRTKPAPGFTGAPPEGALTARTLSDVETSTRDPRNRAVNESSSSNSSDPTPGGGPRLSMPGYDENEETISVQDAQRKITENWNRMVADEPEGRAAKAMDILKERGYKATTPEHMDGFLSTMPLANRLQVPKSTAEYLSSEERARITQREGLNIGEHKKRELANQFSWYAASDPVQHGIDAGIVGGVANMVIAGYKPQNRNAGYMVARFGQGFLLGMSVMVGGALAWAEYQMWGKYDDRKQISEERRRSFYARSLEAQDSK